MLVHLDKRLQAVADFVRLDKRIADIGTDHALLPCYLHQHGARKLVASDISDGPLQSARQTLEMYGISDVTLIKSDGMKAIPPQDDVIIAGMGGEMIADIIKGCNFLHKDLHFILQPMTRDFVLRKQLYRMGCAIFEEKTAMAGGKVYTIMLCGFTDERCEIPEKLAFLGKNRDEAYREKQLKTLSKMAKGNPHFLELQKEIQNDR